MVGSRAETDSEGEITLIPGKSLQLWKIRSRAYYFGQQIIEQRISIRDAVQSAQVRSKLDPDANVEDSFLNHNLSIGYEEFFPLKEYLAKIRSQHQNQLKENA